MKKQILAVLLCMAALTSISQPIVTSIYGDSIKITRRDGEPAELILKNASKNITGGVLMNIGGGRTAFVTPPTFDSTNLNLTARFALKLNISDTTPFLRKTQAASTYQPIGSYATTSNVALKLNISDTTPFLRKTQAASTYYLASNPNNYFSKTGLSSTATGLTYTNTTGVFSLTSGYYLPTTSDTTNWGLSFRQTRQWDGGATGLVATTGRTSLGATTVGGNFFTLANPSAITFPRINADNSVSLLSASVYRTAIGAGDLSGSGLNTNALVYVGGSGVTSASFIRLIPSSYYLSLGNANPLSSLHCNSANPTFLGHTISVNTPFTSTSLGAWQDAYFTNRFGVYNTSFTGGGALMQGYSGANSSTACVIDGNIGGTAPSVPAILLQGWKSNGTTGRVAMANAEIILGISAGAGSNLVSVLANGSTLIGTTTPAASAILNISSTTQGFLPPKMTTTQKTAIASPAEGLQVYDLTIHQMSYYNGTTWINF